MESKLWITLGFSVRFRKHKVSQCICYQDSRQTPVMGHYLLYTQEKSDTYNIDSFNLYFRILYKYLDVCNSIYNTQSLNYKQENHKIHLYELVLN